MLELNKEQLDELQAKAIEINIASEAILDLIMDLKIKDLSKKNKEPDFWKKVSGGKKNDRAKRVAKRSDE